MFSRRIEARWATWLGLFGIGVIAGLAAALMMPVPGYMDAEYYYAGGIQLVRGEGFREPYIWNFLNDPQSLPQPSYTYWMPLASLISAAGMWIKGSRDFLSARLFFVLLCGFIPLLSARLCLELGGSRRQLWLAGLLGAFCGFYSIYLSNTETFSLYMVLGSLYLLIAEKIWKQRPSPGLLFCLGVVSGLMHLSRADGLLWLLIGFLVCLVALMGEKKSFSLKVLRYLFSLLFLVTGYFLVMMPWFWRNLQVFGSLMPPGGLRALWMTDYNELFSYPAKILTFEHWATAGWTESLLSRGEALWMNLKNLIGVQGEVFLLPLICAGGWTFRKEKLVILGGGIWTLVLLVMSLVFPFAGGRGGYLHASAAVQPFFWALAVLGLDVLIDWGVRARGWKIHQASRFFSGGLVFLAVLFTGMVFLQFILTPQPGKEWDRSYEHYILVEKELVGAGAVPGEAVLVNNPPGYYLASSRPAVVIPNGDTKTLLAVAGQFGIRFVILETSHVEGLNEVYKNPREAQGLERIGNVEDTELFRIKQENGDGE